MKKSQRKVHIRAALLTVIFINTACSFVRAPSPEELAMLDNPPAKVRAKQDRLTPLALQWLNETESELLIRREPLAFNTLTMCEW